MKRFGTKNTEPEKPSRAALRVEFMMTALPTEKIGEVAMLAAARLQEDETIAPEVARFADEYFAAFRSRLNAEQQRRGDHALVQPLYAMVPAGTELEQKYGNPLMGDFVLDPTGLVDGANATDARFVAEYAMGQVFHDMINPPPGRR